MSKEANWLSGKAAVMYGQMFGSNEVPGEMEDILGKPVEAVVEVSKQHPHLSYILIVLSWLSEGSE